MSAAGRAAALALAVWLTADGALAQEPSCAACRYRGALASLFVAARALGPGWGTLGEAPTDPQKDPDLRAAGVQSVHALHYTLERPGGSDVCSVEMWGFAAPAQALAAGPSMERVGWRVDVRGNLLVMVHGASFRRGQSLRPGLLPACHRLADLTLQHVDASLREPTTAATPPAGALPSRTAPR
jgi:hypothetical protein